MFINTEAYIDPVPPERCWKNNVKYRPLPERCRVEQPEVMPPNSAKIPLTRSLFAIVDEDMVADLSRFSWSVAPDGGTAYAVARDVNKNNIRMHRHILRINNGVKCVIDHLNGNGLDNRRCNLEVTTHDINMSSERRHDRGEKPKNIFKGVWPGAVQGYTAALKIDGEGYTKKNFDNEVEAARYYDALVIKHRGPDARTNLSMGRYTPKEIASFTSTYVTIGTVRENHLISLEREAGEIDAEVRKLEAKVVKLKQEAEDIRASLAEIKNAS